jgi:uncharacterized protein YjbJ (UPF0337 family)
MESFQALVGNNMKTTEEKGSWKEQKVELKQKFAVLTNNEQIFEEGGKEEIFEKLQLKLGKTEDELRKIIAGL